MSIENLKKILESEREEEMGIWDFCTGPVGYRNGHGNATDRLLPLLEKAVEIMNQIGLARCPNYIAHPQSVWFDEHVQQKAREFLLSFSETTESVSDLTKMTEIKKEDL